MRCMWLSAALALSTMAWSQAKQHNDYFTSDSVGLLHADIGVEFERDRNLPLYFFWVGYIDATVDVEIDQGRFCVPSGISDQDI